MYPTLYHLFDPSPLSSFFSNKGAVAGVFTVVGLFVAALLFFLITTYIRKRRARRFDDEVDEAAREAAATAYTANPYLDDDDDDFAMRNAAAKYEPTPTVTSHGTYAQPPMGAESYGMREIHPSQMPMTMGQQAGPPPVPYDPSTYGMAGVGVQRARSRRDGPDASAPEQTPYNRFASPPIPEAYPDPAGRYRGGNTPHDWDLLQAAGLADQTPFSDPYAAVNANLVRGPSHTQSSTSAHSGGSAGAPGLNRQPSVGAAGLLSTPSDSAHAHTPPTSQESYAAHYKPDFPGQAYRGVNPNSHSALETLGAGQAEDPYGGYVEPMPNPHAHAIPNPFDTRHSYADESEEEHREESPPQYEAGPSGEHLPPPNPKGGRRDAETESIRDDEDYGAGRVLRVANE
ncbi:hypothetical protein GLOTRDRAFT_133823 [Gloeophyllum trabeum ATCC 11539]|uniref:Uncharacterized protein n=1 Tax=Gloeophyllum trabeum (strain ATCC 11539 / FP-39264 / Madison 617) TaxID=670483 RepID=S7PSD1_GLOTA|nr:uncharacterized protein GLOTRDRAFT_133823 [Gloeophyllum trabeum ATCC 11539]EPQ50721.1 hypothetical protein GLOTRDRAFT_133823 [Gloeophyllum trabeum ATCC 11539]